MEVHEPTIREVGVRILVASGKASGAKLAKLIMRL